MEWTCRGACMVRFDRERAADEVARLQVEPPETPPIPFVSRLSTGGCPARRDLCKPRRWPIVFTDDCSVAGTVPVDDEAVLGVENERTAGKVGAVGVGHRSGRTTRATITVWIPCCPRYGHDQSSVFVAILVIERGDAAVVVGDPEILPGRTEIPQGSNS